MSHGYSPIVLDPLVSTVPIARLHPGHLVIACDCYVERIEERGEWEPWGWRLGASENIDHHSPVPWMAREVSSATLAIARVEALGVTDWRSEVMLTHTDCDSILSAAIVSGRLPPHPRYDRAAIAADHTGAEDPIADLLQAIQDIRDVEHSLAILHLLERGRRLPTEVRAMLDVRQRRRDVAASAVAGGRFQRTGTVWWAEFTDEVDGEFLPALLPDAEVIVVASTHLEHPNRWAIKVRRGQAMAPGMTLDDLPLKHVDPAYGGRWNAGSTKRGKGSTMNVGEFVEGLVERSGSKPR